MSPAQLEDTGTQPPVAESARARPYWGAGLRFCVVMFPDAGTTGPAHKAPWPFPMPDEAGRTESPGPGSSEQLQIESSTVQERSAADDPAYFLVRRAFARARDDSFDDETEAELAREIKLLVAKHGDRAVEAMAHLILFGRTGAQLANEALRTLGMIQDAKTLHYRRWLLEHSLRSALAVIRDGAVLGLSWLGDPQAIPLVEAAAGSERIAPLRRSMEKLLEQLRGGTGWHTYSE